jgi:hypothetical protein
MGRSRALERIERGRRRARRVGACGFALALALPVVLWHKVIGVIASDFHLSARYLTAWSPWLLMVIGLAFGLPVALSAGRDPESRWYPRSRNAYLGWGVTLYLLGFGLATQVAQLVGYHTPH